MQDIAENGIITLSAGDSFIAPFYLFIDDSCERYTITAFDKLYFSITKPHQPFECGEVRKIFTKDNLNNDGNVLIVLSPEDTENLVPGTYYYEIKFSTSVNHTEYTETVVPKRKFYII